MMPRILSYTPAWLGHDSAGCAMFAPPQQTSNDKTITDAAHHETRRFEAVSENKSKSTSSQSRKNKAQHKTSKRTIARRGTEVFVAVGNSIQWADLAVLKDDWQTKEEEQKLKVKGRRRQLKDVRTDDEPIESAGYKVLKVGVYDEIRQLVPSPNNNLLAVVTQFTVHIVMLPDSSQLDQPDAGPLKLRTFTLGPTIHVKSQAPVVCALWHPLSANGDCLITVTSDAVVRLWEVNVQNRSSFDTPNLDLDLTRLHRATCASDAVASRRMGTNRGFSLDSMTMHAAAAVFGGRGTDAEHGWSSMTLWIAMEEGDVFALCPLLPTKWRSPPSLVGSLTTSIIARKSYAESKDAHILEQHVFSEQQAWLADIDEQEPILKIDHNDTPQGWRMPIYSRPTAVSSIPKMQGPFRILPGDVEDDLDLSDIHVIPPRMDREEMLDEDEILEVEMDGLSTTVVCLVSVRGRIYVTLCLEEIEGQWLPLQKPEDIPYTDPDAQPELILLEALDTLRTLDEDIEADTEPEWPVVTSDVYTRYAFFVTHSQGVFYLSLEPWLQHLEDELCSDEPTGTGFRMNVLVKGASTMRERIFRFEHLSGTPKSSASAAVVYSDSDLGYFVLSSYGARPQSANLEPPQIPNNEPQLSLTQASPPAPVDTQSHTSPELTAPPRQPFSPPDVLWSHTSAMPGYLSAHLSGRARVSQSGKLRLNEQTLETLTGIHRTIAHETHILATAAAEVFRRCERMTAELSHQVDRVRDNKVRLEYMLGEDVDVEATAEFDPESTHEQPRGSRARVEARLERARQRSRELQARSDTLSRKLEQLGGHPLREVEKAWRRELDKLSVAIGQEDGVAKEATPKHNFRQSAQERFDSLRSLADSVLREANASADDEMSQHGLEDQFPARATAASSPWTVPAEMRFAGMRRVQSLLDREEKIVEGVRERLARLAA